MGERQGVFEENGYHHLGCQYYRMGVELFPDERQSTVAGRKLLYGKNRQDHRTRDASMRI